MFFGMAFFFRRGVGLINRSKFGKLTIHATVERNTCMEKMKDAVSKGIFDIDILLFVSNVRSSLLLLLSFFFFSLFINIIYFFI